nr:hypothetical protein [Tanacetum cinerariifolium]
MWARFGFKEIIDNGNGKWLFKFTREDGPNEVASKSPWLVNGEPLEKQKRKVKKVEEAEFNVVQNKVRKTVRNTEYVRNFGGEGIRNWRKPDQGRSRIWKQKQEDEKKNSGTEKGKTKVNNDKNFEEEFPPLRTQDKQNSNKEKAVPMLNYHLRRMWARFGFKEIIDNGNGKWLFKFTREDGPNEVASKSPWLNMPMEAWTNIGISAMASCLGKPKIMDGMTSYVCRSGLGRTEYARVLVEIEAKKGLKEEMELQYRDKDQVVKGTQKIKVEYDWQPPVCSHCNVFGHSYEKCSKRTKSIEEIAREAEEKRIRNWRKPDQGRSRIWKQKQEDEKKNSGTEKGKTKVNNAV